MNEFDKNLNHNYSNDNVFKNCELQHSVVKKFNFSCTGVNDNQQTTKKSETVDQSRNEYALNSDANSISQHNDEGLFSDGLIGLINKGSIGWIILGLIAGILYSVYKSLLDWIE